MKFPKGLFLLLFCFVSGSVFAATSDSSWMDQAWQAFNRGQYLQAISSYEKALQQQPTARAYYGQGVALTQLGRWKAAQEAFEKSVEIDKLNPKCWLGLGWAQQKLGRNSEAAVSFQKVFELQAGPQERVLAATHLAQLGASVPMPSSSSRSAAVEKSCAQLTLNAGSGYDDNLNLAPAGFRVPATGALNDGLGQLGARFDLVPALSSISGLDLDAAYDYKGYLAEGAFDSHDFAGGAAYHTRLLSWLSGEGCLGSEYFLQTQGIQYLSGFGSVGLKSKVEALRVSVVYAFNLENYQNYATYTNPATSLLGNPSNVNSVITARANGTLFPWLVLNGQYQFKSNSADSPGYEYMLNGVGCGAEFFLFSGEHLLSALQINYAYSLSQCPNTITLSYQGVVTTAQQKDDRNIFSVTLDIPLESNCSLNAFYRYLNDQSNYPFLSYVDNRAELSLSYELL